MRKEEIRKAIHQPLWFESKGSFRGVNGFWCLHSGIDTTDHIRLLCAIGGDSTELLLKDYDIVWRCWTDQPSEEQLEQTPWCNNHNENVINNLKTVLDQVRMQHDNSLVYDDWFDDSVINALSDAVAALEPRIMTIEEVTKADFCFIERSWNDTITIAKYYNTHDGVSSFTVMNTAELDFYNALTYMKQWRCWTLFPSDERRKATAWATDNNFSALAQPTKLYNRGTQYE